MGFPRFPDTEISWSDSRRSTRGGSPGQARRFLSAHAVVRSLFNLRRQLVSAAFYRFRRARAFERWNEAVAA